MLRRIGRHFRDQWTGTLALFLVLAGGTAYAANEWTSANIVDESLLIVDIKNGSLLGADVKDGSIGGADVNEASLGKVPDADTLDGMNSTAFQRSGDV